MCALLFAPISEGVIGIKPRGDTREKESTIRSLGWAFRTPIRTGRIIQQNLVDGVPYS